MFFQLCIFACRTRRQEFVPIPGDHLKQGGDLDQAIIFFVDVSRCAAPPPFFRSADKSGTHRIHFYVAYTGDKIGFIENVGGKAALPQMAAPSFSKIDHAGIPAVRFSNGEPEPRRPRAS